MKHREYVYTGETIPVLTETEHEAFFRQLKLGILSSLRERQLLTQQQYKRCEELLERDGAEALRIRQSATDPTAVSGR